MKNPPAVFLPYESFETDRIGRLVTRGPGRCGTIERRMRSLCIEVGLEMIQFTRQVSGIPEEDLVKELTTNTSDQPFIATITQWVRSTMDSHRNRSTLHKLSFMWPTNVNHDGPLLLGSGL